MGSRGYSRPQPKVVILTLKGEESLYFAFAFDFAVVLTVFRSSTPSIKSLQLPQPIQKSDRTCDRRHRVSDETTRCLPYREQTSDVTQSSTAINLLGSLRQLSQRPPQPSLL